MNKYNSQFFIDKFEAIPEENWMTGRYSNGEGKKCAMGHCGIVNGWTRGTEADALFLMLVRPVDINDGHDVAYTQATPKQRILAALRDAQKEGK